MYGKQLSTENVLFIWGGGMRDKVTIQFVTL